MSGTFKFIFNYTTKTFFALPQARYHRAMFKRLGDKTLAQITGPKE